MKRKKGHHKRNAFVSLFSLSPRCVSKKEREDKGEEKLEGERGCHFSEEAGRLSRRTIFVERSFPL